MSYNGELMMKLIANEVCGAPLVSRIPESFSEEELKKLYTLSASHDLAHIVASALSANKLICGTTEVSTRFDKQLMTALYRYEQTKFAYEELCEALESEGIDFIPLKGSVIRDYYPQGWMRTSCDIDVLVHKEDVERASRMLVEKLSYTDEHLGSHDVSFFTSGGVHIELHYDLLEDDRANNSKDILASAWDYAQKKNGFEHTFELSDDMFYFYHIAHIAKHLEIGGCGVRPFLDLWLLLHKVEYDAKKREELLLKGNLLDFSRVCEKLCEVWFGDAEHEELTLRFEAFILNGGSYGTRENRVAALRTKRGGKFKYAMSRIFLSYDVIKYQYPILFKHKWLLPVANVRRWCRLLFCGGAKRSMHEFKMNSEFSQEQVNDTADLFKKLGL